MVNEARIGVQRAHLEFEAPWTASSQGTSLLPSIGGVPYIIILNGPTSPYTTGTGEDPQGRITPVYQASDKITWLRGRHALKAGIELRIVDENSFHAFNVIPRVTLGTGNVGTQNITTIAGIGANSTLAKQPPHHSGGIGRQPYRKCSTRRADRIRSICPSARSSTPGTRTSGELTSRTISKSAIT